jgi:hypothetical protein
MEEGLLLGGKAQLVKDVPEVGKIFSLQGEIKDKNLMGLNAPFPEKEIPKICKEIMQMGIVGSLILAAEIGEKVFWVGIHGRYMYFYPVGLFTHTLFGAGDYLLLRE